MKFEYNHLFLFHWEEAQHLSLQLCSNNVFERIAKLPNGLNKSIEFGTQFLGDKHKGFCMLMDLNDNLPHFNH
jgi:inhibitor of KinA sporulation pathway (predicted exonuclease)